MMPYTLGVGVEFDLDSIWEHIARDKVEAADRWIGKLFDAFEKIAMSPAIGHKRKDLTDFPVLLWPGAYLNIYRVHQEAVEIVAVTQRSRDIPSFLTCRSL